MCAKTSHARKHLCFLDLQAVTHRNMLAYSLGLQLAREKRNCKAIFLCDDFHITEQLCCKVFSSFEEFFEGREGFPEGWNA